MKRALLVAFALVLASPMGATAAGDGKSEPVEPAVEGHPLSELWSGYHFASPEIRKLQDSDEDNPAYELFGKGEAIWKKVDGKAEKSCASCHGDAAKSMRGAAASYPALFKLTGKPLTLEARMNLCREKFMQSRAFPYEAQEMLALSVYVRRQSKGLAVNVNANKAVKPFLDKGKSYYASRRGQLGMSCAGCHEKNAGKLYRGQKLSQGHANGFPAYRKSWNEAGSLLRQVNQCLARVRANPLRAGSEDFTNLELYLSWRANGLRVETPAVRE